MPARRRPCRTSAIRSAACWPSRALDRPDAQASVLTGALVQEHERAFGAWHAEWPALVGALGYTAGAVDAARRALDGLEVHEERMQANLQQSGREPDPGSAEAFVERALASYRGVAHT